MGEWANIRICKRTDMESVPTADPLLNNDIVLSWEQQAIKKVTEWGEGVFKPVFQNIVYS